MMAVSPRHVVRVVRYLAQAGLWLALALVAAEGLLRVAVEARPFNYTYDGDWGWEPVAGSIELWAREGYGITRYLAHGEIATPYDDGDKTVVVLGDSHTEARQVNGSDNFVSVAERALRQQGLSINLRNLGRTDAGLPDYVYLAPFIKEVYRPDLVVVQISAQDFTSADAFGANRSNYFVLNGDAVSVVHVPAPHQNGWLGKLMHGSTLYAEYVNRSRVWAERELPSQGAPVAAAETSLPPRAPETVGAQLAALKAAYSDVPMILLILPQVPALQDGKLVEQVGDDEEALAASAQAVSGWTVVDPLPQFVALAAQGVLPRGFWNRQPGRGHLNVDGHRAVGLLLAEQIAGALK
nr:hypothetical protein [Chloroflexota bacterium]